MERYRVRQARKYAELCAIRDTLSTSEVGGINSYNPQWTIEQKARWAKENVTRTQPGSNVTRSDYFYK